MNFNFIGMNAYRGVFKTHIERSPSHVYCSACGKRLSVKSGVCEGDDMLPYCYECAKEMGDVKTILDWHENQLIILDKGGAT